MNGELKNMLELGEHPVAEVVLAIGMPTHRWPGNCYAVASALFDTGLVPGRLVYGHWLGPVAPGTMFDNGHPFQRHGWIVLNDMTGRVLDLTRWVFEGRDAYVYVGEPGDETCQCGHDLTDHYPLSTSCGACDTCDGFNAEWPYDEGGDTWRRATRRPFPLPDGKEPWGVPRHPIAQLLPRELRELYQLPALMTRSQVAWLANLPYAELGTHARTVYELLERRGDGALIPIDNLRRAGLE